MKLLTGTWANARGNPASCGKLFAYLNQDAVALASNQIVPRQVSFQLDLLGSLGPDATIWANDELSPSTTFYRFAVLSLGGGLIWGPEYMIIRGTAPINFNSLTPSGGMPPVFQTTGLRWMYEDHPLFPSGARYGVASQVRVSPGDGERHDGSV